MKKLPSVQEIKDRILNHPKVLALINWTKTHSFPGFLGVPIYDVFVFLYNEIQRESIGTRANSIAFSFFLSLFPTAIALFTLVPFFLPYLTNSELWSMLPNGNINFNDTLVAQMREVLPDSQEETIIDFLRELLTRPRAGLLSFGFFLAIFFASNGMLTLMRGFEKSYQSTFIKRNVFQKRWIAIQLTFLIALMVLASVVLIILGDQLIYLLGEYIEHPNLNTVGLTIIRWVVLIALFYFIISIIYRKGVPTRKKFTLFSTGASLATLLSLLSTLGFSIYIDNFGTYNKLYGSIGTIIVIMLWIQINASILLIGFELNASIAVNRDLKAEKNED
ncbi:MAG: YihY/virulence factor BrkB family protein [Bacteroidota bacterium]